MSTASKINSIIKIKKIKSDLSLLPAVKQINSVRSDPENSTTALQPAGLVPPLSFEALTYDASRDVVFTDDGGTVRTIKQVATARITDSVGTVLDIDAITFAGQV